MSIQSVNPAEIKTTAVITVKSDDGEKLGFFVNDMFVFSEDDCVDRESFHGIAYSLMLAVGVQPATGDVAAKGKWCWGDIEEGIRGKGAFASADSARLS